MKRRLLIISLALALMLMTLTPAAALADNGRGMSKASFTGSGLIYVTSMPDPVIKGPIWRYQGEIVEGFLSQCDWGLLVGTIFYSEHDSVVRVKDNGDASGVMKGTFSLTRPDGSGVLKGTFAGIIRGNLSTMDITDEGAWMATGGTGVFKDVKAWGKWSADLSYNGVTLVGPVTWEGSYISRAK